MIRSVEVDAARIQDWDTLHAVFADAFGFPDFYGRNLDAWIDCMTHLDEDFNDVRVAEGDLVLLHLANADSLKAAGPEILAAIFEMAAFVNYRRGEAGLSPILVLSCHA
jgi:RNAse (barnase) inhibitor barstar